MKILCKAFVLIATTAFAQATPGKIPLAPAEHPARIPSVLLGNWTVGRAYDGGPTDLNEKQLLAIEKLKFTMTPDELKVCGRTIEIKNVTISVMTHDQFATKYRVGPNQIGLDGEKITAVEINSHALTRACGEFSDPGTDVIFDDHDHFVIEVDNLYYKLRRAK